MQKKTHVYPLASETSIFSVAQQTYYMKKALAQAQSAARYNEVPVGAVIVDAQGVVVARAYNRVQKGKSQREHAELRALARAGKKIGDWRLEGCWLFVTLEPCVMCVHAVMLSRLAGVVFGASSPLFGYKTIAKNSFPQVYKKNSIVIIGGVCKEKSVKLLQGFFKRKREEYV